MFIDADGDQACEFFEENEARQYMKTTSETRIKHDKTACNIAHSREKASYACRMEGSNDIPT